MKQQSSRGRDDLRANQRETIGPHQKTPWIALPALAILLIATAVAFVKLIISLTSSG